MRFRGDDDVSARSGVGHSARGAVGDVGPRFLGDADPDTVVEPRAGFVAGADR
jgi:hypothetical protein